ncbi:MAG TPA: hypothetical protein VLZ89_04610 [Anaerolineales bacterium]|nr:hypothetical protein [Anaerolineales bacterium]
MPASLEQAWQTVLGRLQLEMPKASFEREVRGTRVLALDGGVFTVAVCRIDARDWLESRLTSTVDRLLIGILDQEVHVQFVLDDQCGPERTEAEAQGASDDQEAEVRIFNRLPYDDIVSPSRVVAIPGYFSRLIPEIGARNAWLYVGWRQAFWSGRRERESQTQSKRVALKHIVRFSGLSRRTFFRAIEDGSTWESLSGLVEREDGAPRWTQGRDHRSHRLPNRYTVHMTLRLAHADGAAIYEWLRAREREGVSLLAALQQASKIKELAGELLPALPFPPETNEPDCRFGPGTNHLQTVMDIARALGGGDTSLTPEVQQAAEALHGKIISGFGTILLTHYFLEKVIRRSELTPAQAWLVALLRDRCYLDQRTGEVRDEVSVHGGYAELASWLGISRPKTIWEWLRDPEGVVQAFVATLPRQEKDEFDTLRLKVRLDEPLFDGAMDAVEAAQMAPPSGGDDTHKPGAPDTIGAAQLAPRHGAAGTNGRREWHRLKHLSTFPDSAKSSTTTTQTTAAAVPSAWVLRKLLIGNHVHPRVTKRLLAGRASAQAFVSWVLFACSPSGDAIDDPVAYAIASLREDPLQGAGGSFDRLAQMRPSQLMHCIETAPAGPPSADAAMDFSDAKRARLKKILLGE